MSANQSNLSDPHYGYDFVVAATQGSINATMKEYLHATIFPTVRMYWNQDSHGNPIAISYEDLMIQTKGTDPLKVPSWNQGDPITQDITNINESQFYFAFEAAIGIPDALPPGAIPDIVTLQEASQSVLFNLMCANFTVVTCNFGRQGLTSFFSASQPSNAPWLFTSIVALKNIIDNKNLPVDVQKALDNFGPDAFSVQQLFFDLDNAALESIPVISGITPGTAVYTLLSQVFLGAYFTAMKTNAAPVLNYSVVKNVPETSSSTLVLTDMAMEVSPYVPSANLLGSNNLNTLNYLCATDGAALPPPVPFAWNWIEQSEESSFDGVIAINRNKFINYLNGLLSPDLGVLDVNTNVSMTHDGLNMSSSWSFNFVSGAGQTFTVLPAGQPKVDGFSPIMSYSYSCNSSDSTEDSLHLSSMNGDFNYNVNVVISVNQNSIQVITHVVSYLSFDAHVIGISFANFDGNVVDYTNTVLYTLSAFEDGTIKVNQSAPNFSDNSQPLNTSGWDHAFCGDIVDAMNGIKNQLLPVAQQSMMGFDEQIEASLNGYSGFVFPGGKTFAFKDVSFSDNLDFVSHITYLQPAAQQSDLLQAEDILMEIK